MIPINNELYYIKDKLNSSFAQSYLEKYEPELEIYQYMVKYGANRRNNDIMLYFNKNEFIGFLVHRDNYFKIDENKKPLSIENDYSFYNTNTLGYVEVRSSIRKNSKNPRYGKMIIEYFINKSKIENYDAICLYTENNFLFESYYPKYGFTHMELEDNTMILWLK